MPPLGLGCTWDVGSDVYEQFFFKTDGHGMNPTRDEKVSRVTDRVAGLWGVYIYANIVK